MTTNENIIYRSQLPKRGEVAAALRTAQSKLTKPTLMMLTVARGGKWDIRPSQPESSLPEGTLFSCVKLSGKGPFASETVAREALELMTLNYELQ